MSLIRRHALAAVLYDSAVCGGITQQNIITNTDVRGEPSDAEVYNRILSLIEQKIAANFTTLCPAQHLDQLGAGLGASINGMTAGLSLFGQSHLHAGTRAGANLHRKYNFASGVVFPQVLSCTHRGDAQLTVGTVIGWNGSDYPVVITDTESIPEITTTERFTLGGVTIGGVALSQKTDVSINFGITVESEGADSVTWNEFVSIISIEPVIDISGIDIEWFKAANIPLTGAAATHADTMIYFRKRAHGGTFVLEETAEHISITAAGLIVPDTCIDASGQGPAQCRLRFPCYYDGTNAPLIIDTSAAIV